MRIQTERNRLSLGITLGIAAFLAVATAITPALAEMTVTVTHPEAPPPTYIDNGTQGESAGDVRIFHFDAIAKDGGVVPTDWIMTTTGVDTADKDIDSRVVLGIFTFGSGSSDQLMLQGVAFYPNANATLKPSSSTIRAIIGGTGKFSGASGWVDSVHLEDGTWRHVFHIKE